MSHSSLARRPSVTCRNFLAGFGAIAAICVIGNMQALAQNTVVQTTKPVITQTTTETTQTTTAATDSPTPAQTPAASQQSIAAQASDQKALTPQQQRELESVVAALKNDPSLSVPPPEVSEAQMQNKAYDQAVQGLFPLTPAQIKDVMQRLTSSQKAAAPPPAPEPKAEVKVENISLDPGVTPPTIYVANGYVTTMTILDSSGQPWPIQDVTIGGNFKLPGGAEGGGHMIRIVPDTRFGTGNLSVRLVGLTTPLTFRLQAGADVVYYRYDARVPQLGPNVKTPLIDRGVQTVAGDDTLMTVLQGLPPEGAERLSIEGTDRRTKAWQQNNLIYLRTPLTLLSPTWDSSVASADGTNVYSMAQAPVLLLSDNGKMVRARILGPVSDTAADSVVEKKDLKEKAKNLDDIDPQNPILPVYKPDAQ